MDDIASHDPTLERLGMQAKIDKIQKCLPGWGW